MKSADSSEGHSYILSIYASRFQKETGLCLGRSALYQLFHCDLSMEVKTYNFDQVAYSSCKAQTNYGLATASTAVVSW